MPTLESYRQNPLLKRTGVKIEFTEDQVQEYIKCSQDPIYFIENHVKVLNLDRGLVNLKLYDYQREIIELYHNNKLIILKQNRQSGKTTTTMAYLLWLSLFNEHKNIAILANKGSLAREILDRYQLAYESLDLFLQQGIVVWNKGNVELENGSKIIASSTSSSAIRGYSFHAIFMDEVAHIQNNIAEDFYTSVFPTISSGKDTKLIMASTPRGMNLFYKFWTDAKAGRNGFIPYEVHWSQVPGRDQAWYDETVRAIGASKFEQEYNCAFLGSTNTLITGEKLATLAYKEPIKKHSDMVIYEDVVKEEYSDDTGELLTKDHTYVLCADVSEGKNLDYSAFSVFDISVMPYRQVARYRNNALPPILYPSILKSCAEYYNNAYVLIEVNNNPQVADLLLEDLEYENVLQVASGNKRAQTVVINKGTNVARGVKMTPLVKRIGCSTLKTLIENDKLVINDFETISELTTFVVNGPSFAAEEGCNDDLCMTNVIFAWLTTQKFFKELVEHDLRKMLQYEHFNYVEEEQVPTPIVTTGLEFEHFIEDGAVWVESSSSDPYGKLYKELFNF